MMMCQIKKGHMTGRVEASTFPGTTEHSVCCDDHVEPEASAAPIGPRHLTQEMRSQPDRPFKNGEQGLWFWVCSSKSQQGT